MVFIIKYHYGNRSLWKVKVKKKKKNTLNCHLESKRFVKEKRWRLK